jgi:hypothetical protein
VMNIVRTCRQVTPDRRRADLRFKHHETVAALDAADQVAWLARAADEGWTSEQLATAIREEYDPPVEDAPAEGGVPEESLGERIERMLELVVSQAQPMSDGDYRVPREVIAQAMALVSGR